METKRYTFKMTSRRGQDHDFVRKGLTGQQAMALAVRSLELGLAPWMTMTIELDPDSPN